MADPIEITKTIEYVQPGGNFWENPKGPDLTFVTANFADGSQGSAGFIDEKLEEGRASLEALKDQQVTFKAVEGKEWNGTQQWKLRDWPGKPAGSGGGGNRGGGSGGGGMSHTQVGLLAAAQVYSGKGDYASGSDGATFVHVTELAELFTQYLFDRKPPPEVVAKQEAARQAETGTPTPPAEEKIALPQLKRLQDLAWSIGYSADEAATEAGVDDLQKLTKSDAEALIEAWAAKSAEKALK